MAASKGMSLRKIAKELGVSHSLLVLWRQGKRSLSPQLEARYHQLVTSVTTLGGGGGKILSGEARFGIKSPACACPLPSTRVRPDMNTGVESPSMSSKIHC